MILGAAKPQALTMTYKSDLVQCKGKAFLKKAKYPRQCCWKLWSEVLCMFQPPLFLSHLVQRFTEMTITSQMESPQITQGCHTSVSLTPSHQQLLHLIEPSHFDTASHHPSSFRAFCDDYLLIYSIQFLTRLMSSKTDVLIPSGSKTSAASHAELCILNTLLQVNLQFSWVQSLESVISLGCFLVLVYSHFFFCRTGEQS